MLTRGLLALDCRVGVDWFGRLDSQDAQAARRLVYTSVIHHVCCISGCTASIRAQPTASTVYQGGVILGITA